MKIVQYVGYGPRPRRASEKTAGGAGALALPDPNIQNFGFSALEAMFCGTLCAALRHGAVGEIIEEGVTAQRHESPGFEQIHSAVVLRWDRRPNSAGCRATIFRPSTCARVCQGVCESSSARLPSSKLTMDRPLRIAMFSDVPGHFRNILFLRQITVCWPRSPRGLYATRLRPMTFTAATEVAGLQLLEELLSGHAARVRAMGLSVVAVEAAENVAWCRQAIPNSLRASRAKNPVFSRADISTPAGRGALRQAVYGFQARSLSILYR